MPGGEILEKSPLLACNGWNLWYTIGDINNRSFGSICKKEYNMITVSDLGLQYSGQPLFSHVDLQFIKEIGRAHV